VWCSIIFFQNTFWNKLHGILQDMDSDIVMILKPVHRNPGALRETYYFKISLTSGMRMSALCVFGRSRRSSEI